MIRKVFIQFLIVSLGPLIMSSTAVGVTWIGAEQQVRARSAYIDEEGEHNAVLNYDPESPKNIGDADLETSASMNGANGSASLVSSFGVDQVTVNASTEASAVWGSQPEDAIDVHGNGQSRFWLHFKTDSLPAHIQIDALLNVGVYNYPTLYPEQARTWIRLETFDNGNLVQVWAAELDGGDVQTSLQVNDGLSLDPERDYYLVALAESSIPAWSEYPQSKTRAASFSLTAKIESAKIEIVGSSKVVLANKGTTPLVKLDAICEPLGGSYKWEIIAGYNKAKLRGNVKSSSIAVVAVEPSESPGDVVVQLTYEYESRAYPATHELTIQLPTAFEEIDYHTTSRKYCIVLDDYITIYNYRCFDQFGDNLVGPYETKEVVGFVYASPDDYFRRLPKKLWRNRIIETGSCNTTCQYQDVLYPPRDLCLPLPDDHLLIRKQYIYVQGWLVKTRRLFFLCDQAISEDW